MALRAEQARRAAKATHRTFEFRGAALELQTCNEHEAIISGPAETGKTVAALYKLNRACRDNANARCAIVRKTRASIDMTVLQTWNSIIEGTNVQTHGGLKPYLYTYPNGSRVWIAGMDKPERVLSAEFDMVYVNQAEELILPEWETLLTRTTGRAGNVKRPQLFGDCNPSAPTHWILARSRTGGPLRLLESFHRDNPTLYDTEGKLTERGNKTLEVLDSLTGARRMRLRLGLWAQPEGAIYDVFAEERHKVKSFALSAIWPRVVGIDPFGAYICALWMAFDPTAGVLNVYREYYQPFGITTPGHVKNILDLSKNETIFAWIGGGPSERQARLDWQAAGIPLLDPGIGDVWAEIDRVYQLLREFKLVIHDSCVNLLSEIGAYKRKIINGIVTEQIENKESFHALDALRYAVAWLTAGSAERSRVIYAPVKIGPDW